MKVAVYAGSKLGHACLSKLISLGSQLDHLFIMKDDSHEKPWRKKIENDFSDKTKSIFIDPSLEEQEKVLSKHAVDIILVFNWRKVIPQRILDLSKNGAVGLHAAKLPSYRGFAPLNWALVNGESEVAASLLFLGDEIDNGPLVAQKLIKINSDDNIISLSEKVEKAYLEILDEIFSELEDGKINKTNQKGKPNYTCKRLPEDGLIDWKKSAAEIHNLVRALKPPLPGAYTYLNGRKLYIFDTLIPEKEKEYIGAIPGRVIEFGKNSAKVLAGEGILEIRTVGYSINELVAASNVLSSIKQTLGINYEIEFNRLNERLRKLEIDLARLTEIKKELLNR